ncbi:MAG: hypothetical protein NXI24_20105 [bacterium]|nr:hypothetical protein [bacterium]
MNRLCRIARIVPLIGAVVFYSPGPELRAQAAAESPGKSEAELYSLEINIPDEFNAGEIAKILRRICGKNATIAPDRLVNKIAVIGSGATVRQVERMAKLLLGPQRSRLLGPDYIQFYRASHITADSLASVLVGLPDPDFAGIRVLTYGASNSLIIFTSPEKWNKILPTIQDLDQLRLRITLKRDQLLQRMKQLDEIYENKFSPVIENGEIAGWKMIYVPQDNFLYLLGIRSGDTLRRFNGETLENQQKLHQMWQNLQSSSRVTVDIERGGKIFTYDILIQ